MRQQLSLIFRHKEVMLSAEMGLRKMKSSVSAVLSPESLLG